MQAFPDGVEMKFCYRLDLERLNIDGQARAQIQQWGSRAICEAFVNGMLAQRFPSGLGKEERRIYFGILEKMDRATEDAVDLTDDEFSFLLQTVDGEAVRIPPNMSRVAAQIIKGLENGRLV